MRFPWRNHLLTGALLSVCLLLLYASVRATLRHVYVSSQLAEFQVQLEAQERANARIADELARMRQPTWLALLARERLNFKLPDEQVVFVYKSEKPGTIAQPQQVKGDTVPNWRKWIDWVRGK